MNRPFSALTVSLLRPHKPRLAFTLMATLLTGAAIQSPAQEDTPSALAFPTRPADQADVRREAAKGMAPEIEGAEITLPWSELRRLIDAAHDVQFDAEKKETAPPVTAVLEVADYQLDLSGETTLSATFVAKSLHEGWHTVPLFSGDVGLTGSALIGEQSSLVRIDGEYRLLLEDASSATATLELAVPARTRWLGGQGLVLRPAPAIQGQLRVIGIPEGFTVSADDLRPLSGGTAGEALVFQLPPDGRELKLRLEKGVAESVPTAEAPPTPSHWSLHSQVLVQFSDGRLRFQSRIDAQADQGSGLSATLLLPSNASRISVESEDLRDWELLQREAQHRGISVRWETRDRLDRTLLVSWEVPQSPLAKQWSLALPAAAPPSGDEPVDPDTPDRLEPATSHALIAIVPPQGLELRHEELEPLVTARNLPGWLRSQLGSTDCLVAEAVDTPAMELEAEWLPVVETAQATISLAAFETRVVADGSMLVKAEYEVQHRGPLEWTVQLPDADQILVCEVDEEPTKPIRRSDETIEFRLASPSDKEGAGGTRVHLCYATSLEEALDPVSGRLALELPKTALFIHKLDWRVAIPDRYEPTAVEGNVSLSSGGTSKKDPGLIQLEKDLCRGESPAVEIFYQRRDLASES